MLFSKKRKQTLIAVEPVTEIKTEEEAKEMEKNLAEHNKQVIEELMTELTEHSFVSISPNDGTYIDTVRTTDVMRILCNYFGIDGSTTSFSDYV